jgi:hypothetical protein
LAGRRRCDSDSPAVPAVPAPLFLAVIAAVLLLLFNNSRIARKMLKTR